MLVQCQRDRQLRFALPGIVSRLGEMRRAQMEADTAIRKQISDYIVTVMIVLGAIPLMGAMMPEWYTMLTTTPAGKITLAVVLAAVLATAVWVARLYRPVEGGETTMALLLYSIPGFLFAFGLFRIMQAALSALREKAYSSDTGHPRQTGYG